MIDFFDINNFNLFRLHVSFVIIFFANSIIFRKRYHSFLDPLFYLLFWSSTIFAVCIELTIQNPSVWTLVFLSECILINLFLYLLFGNIKDQTSFLSIDRPDNNHSILLVFTFLIIFLIDGLDRWIYVSANGAFASAIYKFGGAEKKGLLLLISYNFVWPFFIFIFNYLLFFGSSLQKKLVLAIGFHNIVIFMLTGERGVIMHYALSIGFSAFFFRAYLNKKLGIKINKIAIFVAIIIIFGSSFVSTLVLQNTGHSIDISDAFFVIQNRIFGNADGLYYFLSNNGFDLLSPFGFIDYNFGVFIKFLTNIEIKNFGWLLMQRVYGNDLAVVQGANYIIHLQALNFFNPFLFPIAIFITIWISSSLRSLRPRKMLSINGIFLYSVASNALTLIADSEYAIYNFTFSILSIITLMFSYCFYILFVKVLRVASYSVGDCKQ